MHLFSFSKGVGEEEEAKCGYGWFLCWGVAVGRIFDASDHLRQRNVKKDHL
jgi:hypothetical protein